MPNSRRGDPLMGDDGASQGSQRSQHSLLERIQMQREREAAQQQQSTPQQIQVPYYGESMPGMGSTSTDQSATLSSSNFFSNAWNNLSASMETTGGANAAMEDGLIEEALLAPAAGSSRIQTYSMQQYLMTFVKDVYGLFMRLPTAARAVLVIFLLYVALRLL